MKKFFSLLLSLLIILVGEQIVFADQNTVTVTVESTFTVTIPENINITSLTTEGLSNHALTALKLNADSLLNNGNVRVTINGSGASGEFILTRQGDVEHNITTIPFVLKNGTTDIGANGFINLTPATDRAEVSIIDLNLNISGSEIKKAGKYTGNIIFTCTDAAAS